MSESCPSVISPHLPFLQGEAGLDGAKGEPGVQGEKGDRGPLGLPVSIVDPARRLRGAQLGVLKVPGTPELRVVLLSHLGETLGSDSLTEACSGQALVSVWGDYEAE